jgi:hypothetical protein
MRRLAGAWRAFETREALLLACFATLVVLARAALRLRLHVPGHMMFATALFLILARGLVRRPGAATATGLLAGLVCAALGMGRGGPLVVLRMALPGLVVDLGAGLGERTLPETLRWPLVGALAGASDFVPAAAVELLAGAPGALVVQHALVASGTKAAFGALGGLAALAILRRLRDHGMLG